MADLDFAKRLGRLKSGDSRTKTVGARLSRSEERELIAAAIRGGRNVSEWCREALLREARRSTTDPILTEIIANRMLLINALRPLIAGQKMSGERFDELLTAIKAGKRNAAQEVLEQYAVELPQEASDGE